jgi:hypothetical protein
MINQPCYLHEPHSDVNRKSTVLSESRDGASPYFSGSELVDV